MTRAHVIECLKTWTPRNRPLHWGIRAAQSRHRLASLTSLFEYLCETTPSPTTGQGVKRPAAESGEGKTPAIGDHQAARVLLAARRKKPSNKSGTAPCYSTFCFTRCAAPSYEAQVSRTPGTRAAVFRISTSPAKATRPGTCRCIPAPTTLIHDYLDVAGHGDDENGGTVPARSQQPHRPPQDSADRPTRFTSWYELFRRSRLRDRRACAASDGRDQRARPPGRHRQGAGMARPRQHRHHPDLRSPATRPEDSPTFKVVY